uniref:Odorant receptor n=1 Tax=Protaetia brevitarsis TaxID=348688 RepID=A0A411HR66_PROBE|nr:odorant receptor [Protaetia brevitarsis]
MLTAIIFILSNLAKAEGEVYVETLENFISVFHVLFKYLLTMYYKKDFAELMQKKAKHFWRNSRNGDKHLTASIDNLYKGINILQITMAVGLIVIAEIYFLIPYFNPNTIYFFHSYVFVDSVVVEVFLLACQYYTILLVPPIIMGYDYMYLCLCTELAVQIKLLKQKLKETFTSTNGDILKSIAICVEQHELLLWIHNRMQRIYSITLLFHYFVTLITICFDMYQAFVRQNDLSNEILKMVSLTAIVAQFAFYCVPAELVSSEFADIANAVYMSKWYNHKAKIQKLILPTMIRSQRSHYLSGLGFVDINIEAFGSVIRKAFSFYAVIKQVLNE